MTIDPQPDPRRAVRQEIPIYSSHLDLLRGLAAITVMVGHLKFFLGSLGKPYSGGGEMRFGPPLAPNPNQMNPAHEAVIIFFVLSGVLVGGSVLREQGAQLFSWGPYLLRRLSRLLTVLVPALLIGFVIDSTTRHLIAHFVGPVITLLGDANATLMSLDWRVFLGNLFFLQTLDRTRIVPFGSNRALWSLSFEFWYYLLFPLLAGIFFLPSRRRKVTYGLLAVLIACFLWKDPLSRFLIWLFGAFATQLPSFIPERWQRLVIALMSIQFVACAGLMWWRPPVNFLLDDIILGLSFTSLVVAILHRRSLRPRSLYASLAEHLARPSYSVYLFHLPIMTLIATWSALYLPSVVHHKWVAMLMISPLLYALCYLLYFAFEAHTERVRIAAGRLLGLSKTPRAPLSDRRPQAERIPAATAGRVPIR
jgi:peptidoglycan/LPS O-acetylase OafA/YrhL